MLVLTAVVSVAATLAAAAVAAALLPAGLVPRQPFPVVLFQQRQLSGVHTLRAELSAG
jgi:hypothetical protein